jgi:cell division septation protein DedD
VEQPQTHYQVSFTVRQALLLFVGLLVALGFAYFLGLMTGLTGRAPEAAAAAPAPTAAAETVAAGPTARPESAIAAAPVRPAEARPAAEPTAPAELQLFEDAGDPTPAARRVLARGATPAAVNSAPAADGEFWVQVLSVSSEREARQKSATLNRHKFPASVVPGATARGKVYRVRVGPYRSREEAARVATQLKSTEKAEPWIVPSGQ